MDFKRIELLLEKYWECTATIEEEHELKRFFAQGNVPDQWKDTAELFQFFEKESQNAPLNEAFENEVIKQLEDRPGKAKSVNMLFYYARAAMIALVVLASSYFIREEYMKSKITPIVEDTFEDPKRAFEETKKALMLLSKNLDKGKRQAGKMTIFNEAEQKVKNNNKL